VAFDRRKAASAQPKDGKEEKRPFVGHKERRPKRKISRVMSEKRKRGGGVLVSHKKERVGGVLPWGKRGCGRKPALH